MTDEQHGSPRPCHLVDPGEALVLESAVPDREYLVEQEDLGIEMSGDREREPDVHPGRIPLDGDVDEVADPGEVDDLVELPLGFSARHAEDRAVEEHVV